MREKIVTVKIPKWMKKKQLNKILKEYFLSKSNLNLVLSFKGARIDYSTIDKIKKLYEEWKQSLIHQ